MGRSDSARRAQGSVRHLPGDLAGLDSLADEGEAIALFCWRDVRPLKGVAGFLDWRLCGGLSESLEAGHYLGEIDETMLVPTGGRLGRRRLFLFGLGSVEAWDEGCLARAARRAAEVMSDAGATKALFAAPHAGTRRDPEGKVGAAFARALGGQRDGLPLEVMGILVEPERS